MNVLKLSRGSSEFSPRCFKLVLDSCKRYLHFYHSFRQRLSAGIDYCHKCALLLVRSLLNLNSYPTIESSDLCDTTILIRHYMIELNNSTFESLPVILANFLSKSSNELFKQKHGMTD